MGFYGHLFDKSVKYINATNDIDYVNEDSGLGSICGKDKIYPVFIVLSYTNTIAGKVIRQVKQSTYTHSGICFDSTLSKIYTYNYAFKKYNGFTVDNLKGYIKKYGEADIDVLTIFVDEPAYNKLQENIDYFSKHIDSTKYNFGNILNMALNIQDISIKNKDNIALVCSQFVDLLLKTVNIDISGKLASNLVLPQDFSTSKNPRCYHIFTGKAKNYQKSKIDNKITNLLSKRPIADIIINNK